MQEATQEELDALPTHKRVKAFARALRGAGIEHEVIGRFESVEVIGSSMEELLEDSDFSERLDEALSEALINDIMENLCAQGLAVPTGVDEDGMTSYDVKELALV